MNARVAGSVSFVYTAPDSSTSRVRAAQVTASWCAALRTALQHQGLLASVSQSLAADARDLLDESGPALISEASEAALYEHLAATLGPTAVRTTARFAARIALDRSGQTGERSFVATQLFLFDATRRSGPLLTCVDEEARQATLEVRGARFLASEPWREALLGQHEGVLRHLGYAGQASIVGDGGVPGTLRTQTRWAGALRGSTTLFR